MSVTSSNVVLNLAKYITMQIGTENDNTLYMNYSIMCSSVNPRLQ